MTNRFRPGDTIETLWMRDDLDSLCSIRNRLEVLARDYKGDVELSTPLGNAAGEVTDAIEHLKTLLPSP